MSHLLLIRQLSLRALIALVALSCGAAASAQPLTESRARTTRAVRASAIIEAAVPQERPDDSRIFRFGRSIVRVGQNVTLGDSESVR